MLCAVEDELPLVKESLAWPRRPVRSHVDDLQGPPAHWRLSPEVDGEEGPGVKPLSEGVPGPGVEEGGPGARGGGDDHHDVPPGDVVECDLALDVFQMVDGVDGACTAIRVHGDSGLLPDTVRNLHVRYHGGGLTDVLQWDIPPLLSHLHDRARVH